ncbi:GNAT family N-acetyltransferase [Nocardioides marmotae]|uniref:GNAT family N-acetyltransferase n=1 Tax=Nocardioides marmotae TaxID=2663857 RepID=A0A6I3J9L0_9ACTN|nr:GNAT family N-acetyltransferase [Nocardioides marmotae]MCR6030963.1 GNAT family N-acetyltransferase [Gordonia jinghuaiqii]MBC9731676.1 GNAT family N-acetyltransferase [Nocardioides marmotae]MTB82798.1 GNAT family N-acetyltransferase [Nocardioides marmotae]MTB94600.1 GNAT family N-acetyltransferase [Nocardioides marmotae]QKE01390.1 GNAT family N-acetyltransferase [Nocardioides marmotae]
MSAAVTGWTVAPDSPLRDDVVALLEEHLRDMHATSPAESVHALDPTALVRPGTSFWTARTAEGELLGCVALQELEPGHVELKSMRTATAARRRGVGAGLLDHVLAAAAAAGHRRVSLETGTEPYFLPARTLYRSRGFTECPPFGDYVLDPHSVFFTREL